MDASPSDNLNFVWKNLKDKAENNKTNKIPILSIKQVNFKDLTKWPILLWLPASTTFPAESSHNR